MGRRHLDLTRPVVFPSWVRMLGLVLAGALLGALAAVPGAIATVFLFTKTEQFWFRIFNNLGLMDRFHGVLAFLFFIPALSLTCWVSLITIRWQDRTGTPLRPTRQLLLSVLWVCLNVALYAAIDQLSRGSIPESVAMSLWFGWFLSWNVWWAYDVVRRERAISAKEPPPS